MDKDSDTSPNALSPHTESITKRATPIISIPITLATVRIIPIFMDWKVSRIASRIAMGFMKTKSFPSQMNRTPFLGHRK